MSHIFTSLAQDVAQEMTERMSNEGLNENIPDSPTREEEMSSVCVGRSQETHGPQQHVVKHKAGGFIPIDGIFTL